ncbi:MAG: hypothetical protein JW822_08995 [Spirochaetales bacterium]|nr:hypothetical protein [Spirochaetales bacterium]
MISTISPTAPSIINRLYFSNKLATKITVPVRPLLSPLIALKHLIGIPSKDGMEGIPLYKLRMLDNLIERLSKLKTQKPAGDFSHLINPQNIDSHIKNLSGQIKTISSKLLPYISGLSPEPGTLVNISV